MKTKYIHTADLTQEKRIHFNGVLCRDLYGSYSTANGELMMIYDMGGDIHWIKGGSLVWPESCPLDAVSLYAQ